MGINIGNGSTGQTIGKLSDTRAVPIHDYLECCLGLKLSSFLEIAENALAMPGLDSQIKTHLKVNLENIKGEKGLYSNGDSLVDTNSDRIVRDILKAPTGKLDLKEKFLFDRVQTIFNLVKKVREKGLILDPEGRKLYQKGQEILCSALPPITKWKLHEAQK